jgi:hypothetical protein
MNVNADEAAVLGKTSHLVMIMSHFRRCRFTWGEPQQTVQDEGHQSPRYQRPQRAGILLCPTHLTSSHDSHHQHSHLSCWFKNWYKEDTDI